MVNALAWSVDADAFADWIVYEQTMGIMRVPDKSGNLDSHQPGKPCNHGCHATIHLLGQISESVSLFSAPSAAVQVSDVSVDFPSASPSGPYRPPKLSSLA
jgi:hypothetical protein